LIDVDDPGQIRDAVAIANMAGADVTVYSGTYTNEGEFDIDKPMMLHSDAGAASTIVEVDDHGISVVADDVTIDGFTVKSTAADAIGLVRVGVNTSGTAVAADNVTITNNIFGSFSTIDSTEDHYGVAVVGDASVTNVAITDNEFDDLHSTGSGVDMSGIAVLNNGTAVQGVTITGNDIGLVTGISAHVADDQYGIYVEGGAAGVDQGIDIHGNKVTKVETGLRIFSSTQVSNSGNEIYGTDIGIDIAGSTDVSIEGDYIHNNNAGIRVTSNADQVTVNFNNISNNTTYGVLNTDFLHMLDAELNYWGDPTGPFYAGSNPGGLGNPVNVYVDYAPWWGDDYTGDPHTDPWILWTNPFGTLQDAIDAASTTVADIIVGTAGNYIYEPGGTVNVDKQLGAIHFIGPLMLIGPAPTEVDADLTLTNDDADWNGGLLLMDTIATISSIDYSTAPSNQDLTLNLVTDTGEHSLTLDTGLGITDLDDNVTVGDDLTLMSDTVVAAYKTLHADDDLILA
jgi:hypothetical protein